MSDGVIVAGVIIGAMPRPRRTPAHMLVVHACPTCGRRIRGCSHVRHERRCFQLDLEVLIARAFGGGEPCSGMTR